MKTDQGLTQINTDGATPKNRGGKPALSLSDVH